MLQEWIAELHKLGPAQLVLAIAGNKCDLEDKREVRLCPSTYFTVTPPSLLSLSQVSYQQGQNYASEVNAIFAETSALTAKNVEEVFIEISKYNCLHFILENLSYIVL